MKVSLRLGFRGDDPVNPLDGVLRDLKDMGFQGLELCMSTRNTLAPGNRAPWSAEDVTPELREKILQSAEKHGVAVASLSSDWAWDYARLCPKVSQWSRALELMAADINLAGDLGATSILMHIGTAKGTWEEVKSFCAKAGEVGAKRKVRVGFEGTIFSQTGLGAVPELCKMIDEIDNPYFAIYAHPSYPRRPMQPHEEIYQAGPRLCNLHASPMNVQIDYQKFFQSLKDIGYDATGWWTFEVPREVAPANLAGYKFLRAKFGFD